MRRYFYISDDLDDLKALEQELQDNGVTTPQFHVLSLSDAEVKQRELHEVEAVLRKDVVHSMEKGALIGVLGAALVLVIAYLAGWTESAAGWTPFLFLAIVVLGFCTWEGGLFGIQEPHHQFKRFQQVLNSGRHVFFVDLTAEQDMILNRIVSSHPRLEKAGEGESSPRWLIEWRNNWNGFVKTMP